MKHPIILQALDILACEVACHEVVNAPVAVKQYLRLRLADKPHEVFAVVFLDAQNRAIATEEMFRGTLTQPACTRVKS